jgi:hypothetical protein
MTRTASAATRTSHRSSGASTRLCIIVLGYIVKGPLAGFAWHHLQYVMGLTKLGHEAYFVEDSGDSPRCCYDPSRNVTDYDPTYGLKFATRAFDQVGLGNRWAYYDAHTSQWHGPCADQMLRICARADLLLNLGNTNSMRPWLTGIPVRALVDTDPGFTQIRILTEPERRQRASQHTTFFSFGENVGLEQCTVPQDGFPWKPTRQPVVLDAWSVTPGPAQGKFTTVMQWDSYAPRVYEGHHYGMKSDSFGPYIDLPEKAGPIFELALGGNTAPRMVLRTKGWTLCNPIEQTREPWLYQYYIRQSKGEFSVAKHGYVTTRSGWFSERSACYLASGRPVVVQETGFSDCLQTGLGIVPFRTPEEALAAIEEVNARYECHCRAAREIAAEYFGSDKVLSRLLAQAMIASD